MTEYQLYRQHVKPSLEKKGYIVTRIETTTLAGFPDVIAYDPTSEKTFYIELKIGKRRDNRLCVDWRPGQLGFLKKRHPVARVAVWYAGHWAMLGVAESWEL